MDSNPDNLLPAEQTLAPAVAPEKGDGGDQSESPDNPKPSYNHRRRGRVAKLPKALRDQVNQMLLDGFSYREILEKIGEPMKHVNEDNMRNWHAGGYKDWLLDLQRAEDLGATREAALTLVEQKAGPTVQDAGRTIISAQLYELLLSFDPRAFAAALQDKPELYFRLVSSLSRLSEGEAVCSRRRAQGSLIEDQLSSSQNDNGEVVIPAEKLNKLLRLIKLL